MFCLNCNSVEYSLDDLIKIQSEFSEQDIFHTTKSESDIDLMDLEKAWMSHSSPS